jgi:hypothetical protein
LHRIPFIIGYVHLDLPKMEKLKEKSQSDTTTPPYDTEVGAVVDEVLNASGHKQELERNFSLLSICSIGITTGNVWAALGGSIVCRTIISSITCEFELGVVKC